MRFAGRIPHILHSRLPSLRTGVGSFTSLEPSSAELPIAAGEKGSVIGIALLSAGTPYKGGKTI